MKGVTKEWTEKWDSYRKSIEQDVTINYKEALPVKQARIKRLLSNYDEFIKYYFPKYADAPNAPFHKRFQKKIADNDTIYICRAWAREHGKSVQAGLFIPVFEMFNNRMHNMLLVSHSYDNACDLLMPIMLNLEANPRIINDFGVQKSWRGWETGKFITADRRSFRAIGSGQSPRGTRNEEKRPDFILIDDIDTDEEARNPARMENKWNWVEQALFPTMSIEGRKRFVVVGNIISKQGVVLRAAKMADDYEKIDILDKHGKPSWQRYTLAQVNYMISKISYISAQKEYFNNPINKGTVFHEMKYDKVPDLKKFKYIQVYCDSSYKNSRKNDYKALVAVAELDGKYYVLKARLEQTTLTQMLLWFFDLRDWLSGKSQTYFDVECNGFQDAWYQDVFLPALRIMEKEKGTLPISPDDRDKPDKFSRIEGNLEPLNRRGQLILNIAEKEDPHMRRLEEQFLAIEPQLGAHDDGPDAVEGAVWKINTRLRFMQPIMVCKDQRSKYKY
jgi:hypothetical protein